jgi:hypothetical protein
MNNTFYGFSVEYAIQYGLDEAIMIQNLQFWIMKNKANNKHFYDGRTWTYNSLEAFQALFPFWTAKQIRRIIDSLIQKGIIIKGNYNKTPYDRTSWYAFENEEVFCNLLKNTIFPFGQMKKPIWANEKARMGAPIPYINTDINTDKLNYIADLKKSAQKKVKKEKEPNPSIKAVIDYYHDRFLQEFNVKPVISGADAKLVQRRLKKFSEDEIKACIDHWIQKKQENGRIQQVTLKGFLSDFAINQWLFEKETYL